MATLRGTPRADQLTGTPGDDQLFGLGGDDTLTGLEGDDRLDGGTGRDTIRDEEGGVATVVDLSGDTTVVLYDAEPGSSITTGAGNDTIEALQSTLAFIVTGAGNDAINTASEFNDNYEVGRIDAGPGNDGVLGGYGDDRIQAGPGNDRVRGSVGDDVIDGGSSDDVLNGAGGDGNATRFGDGADLLIGNAGDDTLIGTGNGGRDTLLGGAGDDTLDPGFGNVARGGPGDDRINGGGTLAGDGGADTFYYRPGWLDETYLEGNETLFGRYPDTILDFRPAPLETVTVETDNGPLEVSRFAAGGDVIDLDLIPYDDLDGRYLIGVDPETGAPDLNWQNHLTLQVGDFGDGNRLLIGVPGGEVAYLRYVPPDLDAFGEALFLAGTNIDLAAVT